MAYTKTAKSDSVKSLLTHIENNIFKGTDNLPIPFRAINQSLQRFGGRLVNYFKESLSIKEIRSILMILRVFGAMLIIF